MKSLGSNARASTQKRGDSCGASKEYPDLEPLGAAQCCAGPDRAGLTPAALETFAAYERWASTYPPRAHNPLMRAEQQSMLAHFPDLTDMRVLDLACGSGRYAHIMAQRAARVVALDFSPAMLRQVSGATAVQADMERLPFANRAFDFVICGLAVGHAADIYAWMVEVARVLAGGATLLYSDFHPQAAHAGLTRSFKDPTNRSWTVPHHTYHVDAHQAAALAAGLDLEIVAQPRAGIEMREAFPGSEAFYECWTGLPLVLVAKACKRRP